MSVDNPEQILDDLLINYGVASQYPNTLKGKALAALNAYSKALRRADMEAVIEGDYDEERKRIMEERLNG